MTITSKGTNAKGEATNNVARSTISSKRLGSSGDFLLDVPDCFFALWFRRRRGGLNSTFSLR